MGKNMLLFLVLNALVLQFGCIRKFQGEPIFSDSDLDTGGLSRKSFPKGFVFGAATSAYQVEGMADKDGRGPSIWDIFVKVPGRVADNSTAEVTVDQYHHYKEDIDILKKFKFDAYRFSISWSRIFPNGTGEVNWKGVDYYNRLIDYMIERGITPYANLYHFDLPQALQDRYLGWLNEQSVKDFADYADFCFIMFGDRVKNWFTFNEPKCFAELGYDNGYSAPGRCSKAFGDCPAGDSAHEPYIVGHNLIKAHAAAAHTYRTKYQAEQNGKLGIVLDFSWYEPLTMGKLDQYAAQKARDFHLGWFLHPLLYGEYPKTMQEIVGDRLPKFSIAETELIKGSFDYLGLNHYTTYYISHIAPQNHAVLGYQQDWQVGFNFGKNGVPVGQVANSGWLYDVPWGINKAVMYIKERYGDLPIIITENGIDQPGNVSLPEALIDTARITYYKGYLGSLKKAIDDGGANVIGYFAWSLLDNFEWRLGYTSRFGIVFVDYDSLKRYPKTSIYWFRKLLIKY